MSIFDILSLAALESPSRLANPLCITGLVLAFLGLLLAIFSKDIASGLKKFKDKNKPLAEGSENTETDLGAEADADLKSDENTNTADYNPYAGVDEAEKNVSVSEDTDPMQDSFNKKAHAGDVAQPLQDDGRADLVLDDPPISLPPLGSQEKDAAMQDNAEREISGAKTPTGGKWKTAYGSGGAVVLKIVSLVLMLAGAIMIVVGV